MIINKILITSAIFLLLSANGIGQTGNPDIRHFTIETTDSVIKTSFSTKPTKIKLDPHFTYYWYYDGKINHNQGGYSGKLLQGNFELFDASNHLLEKGQFKEGLMEKIWTRWYKNGLTKSILVYKNGFPDGKAKYFDESGAVIATKTYKWGVLHGKYIVYRSDTTIVKNFRFGKEVIAKTKICLKKTNPKVTVESSASVDGDKKIEKPKDSFIKRTFHKIKSWFSTKKKENKDQSTSEIAQ